MAAAFMPFQYKWGFFYNEQVNWQMQYIFICTLYLIFVKVYSWL